MKRILFIIIALLAIFPAQALFAQEDKETTAEKLPTTQTVVNFSNPSQPGSLKANIFEGDVTIRGYEGKDVIIESDSSIKINGKKEPTKRSSEGMKMLRSPASGLTIEESNNVITMNMKSLSSSDLSIKVPYATSLHIDVKTEGNVRIENVYGDIETKCIDGDITISKVSGSVVAETIDGNVVIHYDKFNAKKPLAFSTVDGDIDITLPADVHADIRMSTLEGAIYTDFDIATRINEDKKVEDDRKAGGELKIEIGQNLAGKINGGGIEIRFKTLDGDIYIRKPK